MQTEQLRATLQTRFGLTDFHPGQLETIQSVLAGQDTLAVLPTGSGKSLTYQLSGYHLPGLVLIISPLLSLMQDQVARMQYHGEQRVVALTSLQSPRERWQTLNHLQAYKFVFASPEIVQEPAIQTALKRCQVSLLVIDEAHCISTWGPDFRPDYLGLKAFRQQIPQVPVLMLTATATKRVRQDILKRLGLTNVHQIRFSVDRPNIFLAGRQLPDEAAKRETLLNLVQKIKGPGIIYFSSKKVANAVCEWLAQQSGLRIATYHADLTGPTRYQIQQQFMQGQLDVVCATSAFGMGIDKADIRFVIHYHPSSNLENYVQEFGRAGRDGKPAIAVLLSCPGDRQLIETLNTANLPDQQELAADFQRFQAKLPAYSDLQQILDYYWRHGQTVAEVAAQFQQRRTIKAAELQAMLTYIQTTHCRRQLIQHYFGETPQTHSDKCCAPGDSELPLEALGLQRGRTQTEPLPHFASWQAQLQALFLQKS